MVNNTMGKISNCQKSKYLIFMMSPRISSILLVFMIWISNVTPDEIINSEPLQPDLNPEAQFISSAANKPSVDNDFSIKEADDSKDIETTEISNSTIENLDSVSNNVTIKNKKNVKCKLSLINATMEERSAASVELVNSSRLVDLLVSNNEITNTDTEANCTVVMFYSRQCPFSAMAGPHFNRFARSYPDIKMIALDALKYYGVNTQYGIVGVPTIILFHNGRPTIKFNGTEYTHENFVKFIRYFTGLAEDDTDVQMEDYNGPVPSVIEKEIDYFLVLSIVFIIFCCIYYVSRSWWWKHLIEMIQINWRESTGQHEHTE